MMTRTALCSCILSKWSELGPILQKDGRKYTENVLPIPDPDLEALSKVLSWVYKSYSGTLLLTDDCESKRTHLIAPILWSVVQLLPNTTVNTWRVEGFPGLSLQMSFKGYPSYLRKI